MAGFDLSPHDPFFSGGCVLKMRLNPMRAIVEFRLPAQPRLRLQMGRGGFSGRRKLVGVEWPHQIGKNPTGELSLGLQEQSVGERGRASNPH